MIPENVPEIYVMKCFDASALFEEVLETILTVLPFDLLDRYLFNRRRRNNAFHIPITIELSVITYVTLTLGFFIFYLFLCMGSFFELLVCVADCLRWRHEA